MQITTSLYTNLTAKQRIIATMEAEARGDEAEVERLVKSCPKLTYKMNDDAFVEPIRTLTHLALHTELMIQRKMLGFAAAFYLDNDDALERVSQSIADTKAAWEATLKSMGLTVDVMRKVAKLGTDPTDIIHEFLPDADLESVTAIAEGLQECLR